jgi:hypothetical protein
MTRWFRLYDDVLNDPKVQRLSGDTFKFWINMLCIASKNGGVLPSIEDMAFALRVSNDVCSSLIDELKTCGLIDGSKRLVPHGWEKRQYKSDTSTDRVKRFRERSRNVTETVNETAPDTDTETDTETDKNQKKIPKKRDRSAGSAEFENFWSVYPRKINRAVALKAFEKATRKTEADLIITAVRGYKFADDEQFIPHPATWLNQERWIDGTPTSVRPQVTEAEQAAFLEEHQRWLKEFRKQQLAD